MSADRQPTHGGSVESGGQGRRVVAVDALRGAAALSVVVFHSWMYSSPDPARPVRAAVSDFALFETRIGLVLFFVLSGFLLYAPWARAVAARAPAPSVARYARRRVARIVPAYYVALAGAVVLVAAAGPTSGARPVAASDLPLFLVFAQDYSGHTIMRLNPVTWTLCVEAGFYVLLPVFGVLVWRLERVWRCGQGVAIAALVLFGVAWSHLAYASHAPLPVIKALPACLPYFAVGMAAAAGAERRAGRRLRRIDARRLRMAVAVVGAALVVANAVWHATGAAADGAWLGSLTDLPAAVGFALLVAACTSGQPKARRPALIRPLAAVGVVSYGLYLWHVPLLLLLRGLGALPANAPAALAAVLPLALAAATASWVFVERPALRRARSSDRPHRRRVPVAPRPGPETA